MDAYLITFSLTAREDYPGLWGILKRSPYWHCLGSAWIITSGKTARELLDDLSSQIDPADKLLVARLAHDAAWTASFPAECQEWLSTHL